MYGKITIEEAECSMIPLSRLRETREDFAIALLNFAQSSGVTSTLRKSPSLMRVVSSGAAIKVLNRFARSSSATRGSACWEADMGAL
jgi:hypothetical protein